MSAPESQESGDDGFGDDNFGDFGGFEAAEMVEPQEAQPLAKDVEASAFPWAMISGTVGGGQPADLIQTPTPEGATAAKLSHGDENTSFGQTQATGDIVSGTDISCEFADFQQFAQNSSTSEVSSKVSNLHAPELSGKQGVSSVNTLQDTRSDLSTPNLQSGNAHEIATSSKEGALSQDCRSISPQEGTSESVLPSNEELKLLEQKLSQAEMDKADFQKEVAELVEKYNKKESELSNLTQSLAEQQEKYETLQEKHQKDLESVREAGHEALAVIVEEYKELCKVCVLEAQRSTEQRLQEVIQLQADKCSEILTNQKESFKTQLDEERVKMEVKLEEALEDQNKIHQESLAKALKEETQKNDDILKLSLQEQKDISQKALEEAVQAERQKTTQLLQEEREKMRQVVDAEKEKCTEAIAEAVEKERIKSQECMENAVTNERKQNEIALKEMMEKTLQLATERSEEQSKGAAAVRRRQLTSIDLFLESARKQLDALMVEKHDS